MKSINKALLVLSAVLLLLTVSCGGAGTSGDNPDPTAFVRYHSGSDAYAGYNEIFFDNYSAQVKNSRYIYVMRYEEGASISETIYNINPLANQLITSVPAIIDYYAEVGKTYVYRLGFADENWDYTYSPVQKLTTSRSAGEVTFTQGSATFDATTGKLTFSKIPEITYPQLPGVFDNFSKYVLYRCPTGENRYYLKCFDFDSISGSKFDVYEYIGNYEDYLGKTWTPDGYELVQRKTTDSCNLFYLTDDYSTIGMPDLVIPSELPVIPFVRASTQEGYAGYNEIFFDNYTDLLTASSQIFIYRKTANTDWATFCDIAAPDGQCFTTLSPIIDYFADPNVTYKYKITFANYGSDYLYKTTAPQSFLAGDGLGEIVCTQPEATFDSTTGILTFTTLPELKLSGGSPIPALDFSLSSKMICFDMGTFGQHFETSWISGNEWDIYGTCNSLNKFFDTTWTPSKMRYEAYYFSTSSAFNGQISSLRYSYDLDIGTGIPAFTTPPVE